MTFKSTIIQYVETKQLHRYGHIKRIPSKNRTLKSAYNGFRQRETNKETESKEINTRIERGKGGEIGWKSGRGTLYTTGKRTTRWGIERQAMYKKRIKVNNHNRF